jgi:gamma-glutamyltranspeptidase
LQIPLTNLNSVTVPGAAAGWLKTVEEFGSGKLSMEEILAPAIRMAREGIPEHELNANQVGGVELSRGDGVTGTCYGGNEYDGTEADDA